MASVQLIGLGKQYGNVPVVRDVSLDIADGEFVVLVGPSGCGKSTLLRMIAGLEEISGGELRIAGKRANELHAQERNISMVFQSYALYPHLTVYENIAFGPQVRKEKEADYKPRILNAADMLNLEPYLQRLPRELSGGQRQRVAMGRAVVRSPEVFLFDEPLSNLDAQLRVQMRTEIKTLHQRLNNTIVYVTHDQIEAMTMADRIVVMNKGQVEQTGKPLALYDNPANLFVAAFIGSPSMNFATGVVQQAHGQRQVRLADGGAVDLPGGLNVQVGQEITLGVRPESLALAEQGVAMRVLVTEVTGAETHIHGMVGQNRWCIVMRERVEVTAGDTVHLSAKPAHWHFFDTASTRNLRG